MNSETHDVIFTANATAASKLVGECFPWTEHSRFCYHEASHTSVIGIREKHANWSCLNSDQIEELSVCDSMATLTIGECDASVANLLAFPAQCNFSGRRFNLEWMSALKRTGRWRILIDCASLVSTSPLDLSVHHADFAAVSFYKMFGMPTGLGALIVDNEAAKLLRKTYFGGGTVSAIASTADYKVLRESIHERFEDGTLPFLEILSLEFGFNYIQTRFGGWDKLSEYVNNIAYVARSRMIELRHQTGRRLPVCQLYPHSSYGEDYHSMGPIIAFNILDDECGILGYSQVARLAFISNIHLRVGCFCNPGSCSQFLGLSSDDVKSNFEIHGHKCGDQQDVIRGRPTGGVRISFGFANDMNDVDRWMDFLRKYFVKRKESPKPTLSLRPFSNPIISRMFVYPIKSCGPLEVFDWTVSSTGLSFDRYWKLVDAYGRTVTQKRCPTMCKIKVIDLDPSSGLLTLCFQHNDEMNADDRISILCYGDFSSEDRSNDYIRYNQWFSQRLQMHVQLAMTQMQDKNEPAKSFANQSDFLIVSQSSYDALVQKLDPIDAESVSILNFRPNLVVDGVEPFEEDTWIYKTVVVNSLTLQVRTILMYKSLCNLAKIIYTISNFLFQITEHCQRCRMICINQLTSERCLQPLSTLAQFRNISV